MRKIRFLFPVLSILALTAVSCTKEDAIAAYKNAANAFDKDENNSSEFLFRAALLSETTGKTKEALELYKELKTKYPKTDKGFQADKYIYRLSVEKNDLTAQ